MNIGQLEIEYTRAKNHATDLHRRTSLQAEAEQRPITATERRSIDSAIAEATQFRDRLQQAQGAVSQSAEIQRLTNGMTTTTPQIGASIGTQFVSSDTYEWLRKHKGSLPSGAWSSPSSELMAATLSEDAASGGDLVISDHRPGILPVPTRNLAVASLIAPGTTTSNQITYMKEVSYTNAADTVAEGTTKPESTLTFDAVSDRVEKIAHWVPVTEEILEDVPSLRSYLDARLRLGVQLTEDDQLLNGDGTSPNISGILDRVGLAAAQARGSDTNADAILKQIAAIFAANLIQPDGVIIHPTNWLTIQLLKTAAGEYISGAGPFSAPARPTLWGLPVAVTPVVTVNTAVVGCFRTCSQVFRKGGMRVEASNSHSDFFVKNLVAIRAEERLALAVYRPAAFGTVTA